MFVSGDPLRSPGPRGEQQRDASFLIWLNGERRAGRRCTLPENDWVHAGEVVLSHRPRPRRAAPRSRPATRSPSAASVIVRRVVVTCGRGSGTAESATLAERPVPTSGGRATTPSSAGEASRSLLRDDPHGVAERAGVVERDGAVEAVPAALVALGHAPATSTRGVDEVVLAVDHAVHELDVDVVGRRARRATTKARTVERGADLGRVADAAGSRRARRGRRPAGADPRPSTPRARAAPA